MININHLNERRQVEGRSNAMRQMIKKLSQWSMEMWTPSEFNGSFVGFSNH